MSEQHEDDFIDRLGEMFERQDELQSGTYADGTSPRDFSQEGKIAFIQTNILALTDELHEALAEVGWKPWATSKHINVDAFKSELIDAWHFFMNLCIVVDMTPDELYEMYIAKREKNIKRQTDGYDGVSTKCPGCNRALDDDAVQCEDRTYRHEDGVLRGYVLCAVTLKTYSPNNVTELPARPTNYQGLEPMF